MYYQRLSVVFMALTGVIASPLSGGFDGRLVKRDNQQMARDNGLMELDHEEVEGGRLTYYGVEKWDEIEEPEPTRTVTLAGRADCVDKPVVSCDPDNHQARSNDCDSLVYSLSSDSQRVMMMRLKRSATRETLEPAVWRGASPSRVSRKAGCSITPTQSATSARRIVSLVCSEASGSMTNASMCALATLISAATKPACARPTQGI